MTWDGDPQQPALEVLRGDLLLAAPAPDVPGAESRFERGTARSDAAHAALRAVLDTFTEGFDTTQVAAARAALERGMPG